MFLTGTIGWNNISKNVGTTTDFSFLPVWKSNIKRPPWPWPWYQNANWLIHRVLIMRILVGIFNTSVLLGRPLHEFDSATFNCYHATAGGTVAPSVVNHGIFHPFDLLLATCCSARKSVQLWDLESFQLVAESAAEATGFRQLTFDPTGLFCLVALTLLSHESDFLYPRDREADNLFCD